MTFWTQATDTQRLAQIDGGIELRMSIRQIAINVGAEPHQVKALGVKHGRKFTGRHRLDGHAGGKVARIVNARRAGASNVSMKDAFSIFDDHRRPVSEFLDEVSA